MAALDREDATGTLDTETGTGLGAEDDPAGALPPGLALDGNAITGTPTTPGDYTFTVRATDAGGAQATQELSITVAAAGAPVITIPLPAQPWRFFYGPVQPAGGLDGEITQAQNKQVTLRAGPDQNHEVSFDVDGLSAAAAGITELETDLTVTYDGQFIFQGRVVPTQDTLDASSHRVQVTAYDYREVLRRRFILAGDTLSWTSADQSVIAWNLIQATQARPGGNLGIARGAGQSTGVTRTHTVTAGDYIGDNITALAQLDNGFEWQVTPYGLADLRLDIFHPCQGTSRGTVLAWGDHRISAITRTVDPSAYANAVYLTGNGGKTQHYEAADIGTNPAGRWDIVIGTQDNTQATVDADTRGQLGRLQVVIPSYVIRFCPGAWDGPNWLWLGDTVTVHIDSGRLQVHDPGLRVAEMSFAISADGTETLTATIGQVPFPLHKRIAKILRSIRYLNTR